MSKIRKNEPRLHLVYPDTNILWHDDKRNTVNPAFNEFWVQHTSLVRMELLVSKVVRDELLFQQTTSAVKAMQRASKELDDLSAIASHQFRHRATHEKVKNSIERKIDCWLKDKQAKVCPVPVGKIDWTLLIEKALWRKPPFESDPKNPQNEKGFRDALILETFLELCASDSRDSQIVFLSNDHLLRTSAEKAAKDDSRCLFFQSLDDFGSHIKLTTNQLNNDFIKALLSKASSKFFAKDDPESLLYRDKLIERITSGFKEKLTNPEGAQSLTLTAGTFALPFSSAPEPVQDNKWWVSNAVFIRLDGQKKYFWKSTITYTRLYRKASPIFGDEFKLFTCAFAVHWWANVKADGRFHDLTIDKIEPAGESFLTPTQEQIKAYDITLPTPMPMPQLTTASIPSSDLRA